MSEFKVGDRIFASPKGDEIGLSKIIMKHGEGGWLIEKDGTNDLYSVDEKDLCTAESMIPEGIYCYGYSEGVQKNCPYWSLDLSKPKQANGCCSYLGLKDWEEDTLSFMGVPLLWDQVKSCNIL